MKTPTQEEKLFKEAVEKLMAHYNVSFRVVVTPVGKLSRFIHRIIKRFFILDSAILIQSNGQLSPSEPNRTKK
jgi:hypothetical protein